VVPRKVSIRDQHRLEIDFTNYEFFSSFSLMKNGKSLGIDGMPCDFYKWNTMRDKFSILHMRYFPQGVFKKLLIGLDQYYSKEYNQILYWWVVVDNFIDHFL